jgi:hypothetical protein
LGHEALLADKDLLVEWRGTDSLLHDSLHPKAVEGAGIAADIELMRRSLMARQRSQLESPQGLESPRGGYRGPEPV